MTCEELIEVAAAYSLGILSQEERTACDRHLDEAGPHRGCAQAVAEARAVTASLAAAVPAHAPRPELWRAIEARIGTRPHSREAQRRLWRELAGWFVAAAVIGLYLYSAPVDNRRRATAGDSAPSTIQSGMSLLTAPGTRLHLFSARAAGTARATLILNAEARRAVVLCDRFAPQPGRRLRLWAARGSATPFVVCPLALDVDGVASAEMGPSLFEPSLPDRLLISSDPPGVEVPGEILLATELHQ